ncbi:MAG: protein phosphatase 2C domain-containing protein [Gammaproteobacteria bacterium]|nr:protein phosphatase 2C domain-containing protein [Gammaproteobacteria bacterium]
MHAVGRTDTGRVRHENQDVFALREDLGLAVVADGVSKPRAGGVAAEIAVETAVEYLAGIAAQGPLTRQHLRRALEIANERVFGLASAISAYRGMATTLVVTVVNGARGYVAHVGDSRVYRYRDVELTGITRDHSIVQRRVDAGLISPAQARLARDRHVVTRAVGAEPTLRPDVGTLDLEDGDLLLLCSDGLTEHLEDDEIARHLADAPDLHETADRLVDAANAAGGSDNVTVVLVRC